MYLFLWELSVLFIIPPTGRGGGGGEDDDLIFDFWKDFFVRWSVAYSVLDFCFVSVSKTRVLYDLEWPQTS